MKWPSYCSGTIEEATINCGFKRFNNYKDIIEKCTTIYGIPTFNFCKHIYHAIIILLCLAFLITKSGK